jgi:hypothetical protein
VRSRDARFRGNLAEFLVRLDLNPVKVRPKRQLAFKFETEVLFEAGRGAEGERSQVRNNIEHGENMSSRRDRAAMRSSTRLNGYLSRP